MSYCIYGLFDENGIRYIGISKDPKKRFGQHLRDRSKTHKAHWIRKLKAQGSAPRLEVLAQGLTNEEAAQAEIALIEHYKDCLVNSAPGGYLSPMENPETVEKMRASKKGKRLTPEQRLARIGKRKGEKSARLGVPHTEETKRKISENRRGKGGRDSWRDPELRSKNISEALKGKYTGERHWGFGRPRSKETIEKIRNSVSPASIQALSLARQTQSKGIQGTTANGDVVKFPSIQEAGRWLFSTGATLNRTAASNVSRSLASGRSYCGYVWAHLTPEASRSALDILPAFSSDAGTTGKPDNK